MTIIFLILEKMKLAVYCLFQSVLKVKKSVAFKHKLYYNNSTLSEYRGCLSLSVSNGVMDKEPGFHFPSFINIDFRNHKRIGNFISSYHSQ